MLRFGPCLTGRVGTEFFGMIIGVIVRRSIFCSYFHGKQHSNLQVQCRLLDAGSGPCVVDY